MNIIEAIKSGKKFSRKGYISWYDLDRIKFPFTKEELIADDWLIEEEKITITRSDFNRAWIIVIHSDKHFNETSVWKQLLLSQFHKDKTT